MSSMEGAKPSTQMESTVRFESDFNFVVVFLCAENGHDRLCVDGLDDRDKRQVLALGLLEHGFI